MKNGRFAMNVWCWSFVAAAVIVVLASQSAYADCNCDAGPWIKITTPDEVCFGMDCRQYNYDCGEDGNAKHAGKGGTCPPCDDCPNSKCHVSITQSGPGPGLVDVNASISACNGSDTDHKQVTVVAVNKVTGPVHACAGESKTYSVTTLPDGHYSLITWTRTGGSSSTETGAGASFSPDFPKAGQYTVKAACDSSSDSIAVEVGSDINAPENEACDPEPSVPATHGSNYSYGSCLDPNGYGYGSWEESFELKLLGQTGRGGCNVAVSVGSITLDGGWDLSASVSAFKGLIGITIGYTPPSSGTYAGFTVGPSPYESYKLYVYWIEGTFESTGTQYIPDPIAPGGFRGYPDPHHDTYSASDWLTRVCRWCCS